ncbi:MAG TPA: RNA-binding protein [Kofleriaceae bacterium]|nr:RNA-binding protein [Kofleriaceae bacterium]
MEQKDRATERAARRADRKARAADRSASGQVGPEMGEPIAPDSYVPPARDLAPPAPSRDSVVGTRLYVGNLSYSTDGEDLRALFATKGEVTDVHLVMDRDTGRPRGFAFVTMGTGTEAQKAIAELDGATLDDRQLRVNQAEDRKAPGGGRRF